MAQCRRSRWSSCRGRCWWASGWSGGSSGPTAWPTSSRDPSRNRGERPKSFPRTSWSRPEGGTWPSSAAPVSVSASVAGSVPEPGSEPGPPGRRRFLWRCRRETPWPRWSCRWGCRGRLPAKTSGSSPGPDRRPPESGLRRWTTGSWKISAAVPEVSTFRGSRWPPSSSDRTHRSSWRGKRAPLNICWTGGLSEWPRGPGFNSGYFLKKSHQPRIPLHNILDVEFGSGSVCPEKASA